MAKEIFVLDYLDELDGTERARSLEVQAAWLAKLSVGHTNPDLTPYVHHPSDPRYAEDARFIAEKLETDRVFEVDFLAPHWPMPFVNASQANACIVGNIAYKLHQEGVERAPINQPEQHVIVAQSALAQEFLRLNPGGVAREQLHIKVKSPIVERYYIEHIGIR